MTTKTSQTFVHYAADYTFTGFVPSISTYTPITCTAGLINDYSFLIDFSHTGNMFHVGFALNADNSAIEIKAELVHGSDGEEVDDIVLDEVAAIALIELRQLQLVDFEASNEIWRQKGTDAIEPAVGAFFDDMFGGV
jgi:hypothetical protein